ncbi:MAG: enolase C-terminal domain-like protein [Pseudomonadota bacterium]
MSKKVRWRRFEAPLRFGFKHASANRRAAAAIIVEVREGGISGLGEACPRPYVTGETQESVVAFLSKHAAAFVRQASSIRALHKLIDDESALIDRNPAAFCGLETAVLDLLARRKGVPVERLLDLPQPGKPLRYSAILGDASPRKTRLLTTAYKLAGFRDFKAKLSLDPVRDFQRLSVLPGRSYLRLDANNAFTRAVDCLDHLARLNRPFWAIEEPLSVGDTEGQKVIAHEAGVQIILDESLVRQSQLARYENEANLFVANLRVSKCGGVIRTIALGQAAQAAGIDVVLGAHVGETSILTRAAMTVGQALDREPLAREGAFGRILVTDDITQSSLRFGYGGRLNPASYRLASSAGWGFATGG